MDERDFGCIALDMEHAFAEESGAERNAVESANQPSVAPAFDAMREAELEQVGIETPDARVDPGGSAPVEW